jgi:hypothetical protein
MIHAGRYDARAGVESQPSFFGVSDDEIFAAAPAVPEVFERAYPEARRFAKLKAKIDPGDRFRNQMWDTYLRRT